MIWNTQVKCQVQSNLDNSKLKENICVPIGVVEAADLQKFGSGQDFEEFQEF